MGSLVGAFEPDASLSAGLVDACALGDAAAWRKLHLRYYPVARAFLRKLGVREGELDDATQEVFLQVHRYLPRFRGESELTTWLYRLCVTQARQLRRRIRLHEALRAFLSVAPAESLVSTQSFSEGAALSRVQGALSQLPESERSVFVLYEMEGVPGKQIAEILGCPEATVWRRLHYVRKTFCAALGVSHKR